MHDLVRQVATFDEVMFILRQNNALYVKATVTIDNIVVMKARRNLAERVWSCKFFSEACPEGGRWYKEKPHVADDARVSP